MEFLPLFFSLKEKPCLLVGGGDVALRKARLLLAAGAKLHVVAPCIKPELRSLLLAAGASFSEEPFHETQLGPCFLVVAATNDQRLNEEISQKAHQLAKPVNVVDQPQLCSFIFPAIIDRSPLLIAVSSSGQSPVLARMLRARIESMIPAAFGKLASLLGRYRQQARLHLPDTRQRMRFWERILQGRVAELVFAGNPDSAEQELVELLQQSADELLAGELFVIGVGPGDPDLLTFRALRLMQSVDVVVYDRDVPQAVVNLCRRDAEQVLVDNGTAADKQSHELAGRLVRMVHEGNRVARLRLGDPLLDLSDSVELEQLLADQLDCQFIPGVSLSSACAAYAGIPLLHPEHARSLRFISLDREHDMMAKLDADSVLSAQTLVFYRAEHHLEHICSTLLAAGADSRLPACYAEFGDSGLSLSHADLQGIVARVDRQDASCPALLMVGRVLQTQADK